MVCPASIKHNWEREIHMVLPQAETAIVGPGEPPAVGYTGWVIVNYDILKKHFDLLGTHSWAAFVFDEAHYLKNHRTVRSPLSTQLVNHSLGRSLLAFSKRHCDGQRNDYEYWVSAGSSNIEELAVQLHGIMLRRTKDEVLDLPPKLRILHFWAKSIKVFLSTVLPIIIVWQLFRLKSIIVYIFVWIRDHCNT